MNALLEHVWGRSIAVDRVWSHVTGLAPSKAVGRVLVVLNWQAFMDESFSSEEFVLAGHIASAEAWVQLAREWEELLPGKDGKKIPFKMTNVMARTPERAQAHYRLIEKYVPVSVSCRINMGDLNRALARAREIAVSLPTSDPFLRLNVDFGRWGSPYLHVFQGLLDSFHRNKEANAKYIPMDQKVDFIFDDRTEKKPILDAWDGFMEGQEEDVRAEYGATPRFESDEDFLPLQAADLWAWQVRKWYEEDASDFPDKLCNFDFGAWRGNKRGLIMASLNEEQIFEHLLSVAVDTHHDFETKLKDGSS
jgi:hypothetical protein